MSEPLRVLCLAVGGEVGGVAKVWTDIAPRLQDRGLHIDFLFLYDGGALRTELERLSVNCIQLRTGSAIPVVGATRPRRILRMAIRAVHQALITPRLVRAMHKGRYHAVLLQSPQELIATSFASMFTRTPLLWLIPTAFSQDYFFQLNTRAYRALVGLAGGLALPNSRATNRSLGGNSAGRSVLYLGTQLPPLHRVTFSRALSPPMFAPAIPDLILTIVGRVEPAKGQHLLVEALGRLKHNQPELDVRLIVCGNSPDGGYLHALQVRCAELDIEDRVYWAPAQSNVAYYYRSADAVCSVSTITESFGLTVVEAAAEGRPALASQAGGPGELVVDGKTGWLIPESTVEAVEAGILRVISERTQWEDFGRAARMRTEQLFDIEQTVDNLLTLVRAL